MQLGEKRQQYTRDLFLAWVIEWIIVQQRGLNNPAPEVG